MSKNHKTARLLQPILLVLFQWIKISHSVRQII